MSNPFLRDALELLFVVAVGSMLVAAVRKLRRGEIVANRCDACARPISNAYPRCPRCGAPQQRRRDLGDVGDTTVDRAPEDVANVPNEAAAQHHGTSGQQRMQRTDLGPAAPEIS